MMDEKSPKKADAGGGAWLVTFADLMALLMCFFVLLLSFSELDAQKYKQVAGSMAMAFGVQRKVKAESPPMGTSYVAREFSPGRPDARPISLAFNEAQTVAPQLRSQKPTRNAISDLARRIRNALDDELREGKVEVETEPHRIIIRIREKGSFPSGSATLLTPFLPAVAKLGQVLEDTNSRIVVAGHTDSIPISTSRFRSNWELSSARAVTVIHELIATTEIPRERFVLNGYADVRPLAPNDTPENRALNRRVEIIIEHDPPPADGNIAGV